MITTLLDIKRKVLQPLSLQDEPDYASSAEVTDRINEGIKRCEAMVHNLYEDYFLTYENIALVANINAYELPEDIYARKIRRITYDDSSLKYEILPIKLESICNVSDTDMYSYLIKNSAADGEQIIFYPTPIASSSTNITVYYIREAAQLENDDDELDIPEFESFIVEYARVKLLEKDMENPLLPIYKENLEATTDLMIKTLQQSKLDTNNEIEVDASFYYDFYSNGINYNERS